MEFVDFLIIVVFGVIGIGLFVALFARHTHQWLRASSPPEAGVTDSDTAAEVKAKNRNYHMVTEAVRIFNEIHHQDSIIPFLSDQTRSDIEKFLASFYNNPK